jgi:two-component system chemotaxis response regulator CheY
MMETHGRERGLSAKITPGDGQTLRRRILIVEDEEQVRKPIRLHLTKAGYEVVEVANGAKAIEFLTAQSSVNFIDIIICDIRMPFASGLETIRYCLRHYPSIPLVVLTGYPDTELAGSLLEQGVSDYLVKPVTREELLAVLKRCVH